RQIPAHPQARARPPLHRRLTHLRHGEGRVAAALPVHDEGQRSRRVLVDQHLLDDRSDDLLLELHRTRGGIPEIDHPFPERPERPPLPPPPPPPPPLPFPPPPPPP